MNAIWIGRGLTTLTALFLIFDGTMKLAKPAFVVEANVPLGVPEHLLPGIGITLLVCTALYVVPLTSAVGALLLTGYLGGAVAIQLRAGSGWFEVLFPIMFGALAWGALALRDARVRSLLRAGG